jgi:hypothetical protein
MLITFITFVITKQNTTMARSRVNKYREVDFLPKNAMTVDEYCNREGIKPTTVYMKWTRKVLPEQEKKSNGQAHTINVAMNEIGFEIVVFKGMNFILPKKPVEKVAGE